MDTERIEKMIRRCLLALVAFFSMSAFASDWQVMHYAKRGQLMVDKASIVEINATTRKFWVLLAPFVPYDRLGEGWAYRKTLHTVDCANRTIMSTAAIYFDENGGEHPAARVEDPVHDVVPDTEDDYLLQYVCKADQQKSLGTPALGLGDFLANQVKATKANMLQFGRR